MTQANKLKENGNSLQSYGLEPSIELLQIAQLTENTRVQMLSALAFTNVEVTSVALSNLNAIQNTIQTFETTILTNTQEVHTLANKSLQDAQKSNRSTETQLGSIEEIAAASESLADLSEQLQVIISHFKL